MIYGVPWIRTWARVLQARELALSIFAGLKVYHHVGE
jgi:hypothetical protein